MQKNNTKRKTLKLIGIAGGIGASGLSSLDKWAKPVIQSVVLPAHAETSLTMNNGSYSDTGVLLTSGITPSIMDNLISSAHAWSYSEVDVCIDVKNNIADLFATFDGGPEVDGKLGVPVPFDYVDIEVNGMKYQMNGQFQEIDGQTCIAGNIRDTEVVEGGQNYPYVAKPQAEGCGLAITPPT